MPDNQPNDVAEVNVAETPWEDLRAGALKAYQYASTAVHCWHSVIPRAINYYFDHARAARPADEWRPIGGPPDHEDEVVVLLANGDRVLGFWRPDANGFDSYLEGWLKTATMWHELPPLPPPPTEEK